MTHDDVLLHARWWIASRSGRWRHPDASKSEALPSSMTSEISLDVGAETTARTALEPHGSRSTDGLGEAIAELAARLHAATYELLVLLREFDERAG